VNRNRRRRKNRRKKRTAKVRKRMKNHIWKNFIRNVLVVDARDVLDVTWIGSVIILGVTALHLNRDIFLSEGICFRLEGRSE
jgi:hypothetical protein